MSGTPSRRTFLAWLGALSLPAVLAPTRWWSALVEIAPRRDLAWRLAGVLGDRGAAARVGAAALVAFGDKPGVERRFLTESLVAAVAESAGVSVDRLAGASRSELRRLVGAAIDADYERGTTAIVDGWLLSRTEASVCALSVASGR